MPIRVKLPSMCAKLSFLQSFVLAINQSTSNQFAERKVNSDILQRVNWSNMIFDFFVYWLKLHQDFDRESAAGVVFFLAACFDLFRYGSFKSSHFHSQLFPIDIATYFSTGGIEEWQEYTQRISGLTFLGLQVASCFRYHTCTLHNQNPLLIRNRLWILTIQKARIFRKKVLKKRG